MDEIIDEIVMEIAEAFCNAAVDLVWSMPGNAGQESLVGEIVGDFDQAEAVSEGDFEEVESSHPEAIGEICDAGNAVLEAGAETCNAVRAALEALDIFF